MYLLEKVFFSSMPHHLCTKKKKELIGCHATIVDGCLLTPSRLMLIKLIKDERMRVLVMRAKVSL